MQPFDPKLLGSLYLLPDLNACEVPPVEGVVLECLQPGSETYSRQIRPLMSFF